MNTLTNIAKTYSLNNNKTMDGLSVIICCFNSEKRLPLVLKHLSNQVINKTIAWEVLVVDNASKDNTASIAKELWDESIAPMRVVLEPLPGLSNARKTGLREAKFSLVSFIDDDNWVESAWVEKVYNLMSSNPNIALVGGKGEAVIDGNKPVWFDRIQMAFAVGPQALKSGKTTSYLYGAGFSLRKSAWDNLHQNGFEFILSGRKGISLTSGEDSELCYALMLAGYELYYQDTLDFKHFMPSQRIDWNYVLKLYQAFGRSAPALNLYKSFLGKVSNSKAKRIQNRYMRLILLLSSHISSWPGYIVASFGPTEGREEILRYQYSKYALKEMIRIFPLYPDMVIKIRQSKWRIASRTKNNEK